MGLRKNLREMLSADGKLSSKRVITFIAFVCVVIAFFSNLILLVTMDVGILDGMITIVYAGLGVTVGEHLLKTRTDNENYTPNNNYNSDTDDTRYQERNNRQHNVDTHHDENLGDN